MEPDTLKRGVSLSRGSPFQRPLGKTKKKEHGLGVLHNRRCIPFPLEYQNGSRDVNQSVNTVFSLDEVPFWTPIYINNKLKHQQ